MGLGRGQGDWEGGRGFLEDFRGFLEDLASKIFEND